MVNGSLIDFVDQFQGLEILQHKIDSNAESDYQLVFQMVENIGYLIFYGPLETINNCPKHSEHFLMQQQHYVPTKLVG